MTNKAIPYLNRESSIFYPKRTNYVLKYEKCPYQISIFDNDHTILPSLYIRKVTPLLNRVAG